MADDHPLGPEPWRLILVIEDPAALKVAAAYYALPKKRRTDVDAIAELSGIDHGLDQLLTRLRAAGLLDQDSLPEVLKRMIGQRVIAKINPRG